MSPELRDVVENAVLGDGVPVVGSDNDLFEGLALPFGARDQLVAIIDLGLVVKVVVILQRLLAHAMGRKRIMGIGKIDKFECHRASSFL